LLHLLVPFGLLDLLLLLGLGQQCSEMAVDQRLSFLQFLGELVDAGVFEGEEGSGGGGEDLAGEGDADGHVGTVVRVDG
jgi:hypothetical protein